MFNHLGNEFSNIREATSNDEVALKTFFRQIVGNLPFMDARMRRNLCEEFVEGDALIKTLHTPGHITLVATNADALMGALFAYPMSREYLVEMKRPDATDVMWVSWLGVSISFRRKAVGTALLDAAKMRMAPNQKRMDCVSLLENTGAHELLRENSFQEIAGIKGHVSGRRYLYFSYDPIQARRIQHKRNRPIVPRVIRH